MAKRSPLHYPDLGVLGEELVAQWLHSQGWVILSRRWRSRWGEIDIIALSTFLLVFVEVKTRSDGSWDLEGLLSITRHKQRKIHQTAQCFLARYPHLIDHPCRFDIALVHSQKLSLQRPDVSEMPSTINTVQLGQPVSVAEYQLTLKEYISSAFE